MPDVEYSERQDGARLHRLELLNWGTFHHAIWSLAPSGENALLTGNIGAGKSTIVDALLTLLVPPQKIVYNKAAGSEGRERTSMSYIMGAYKKQKDELSSNAKPVYLRDTNTYSVLLAYFYNSDYKEGVTLAQFLWMKDGKPEKLYVFSKQYLNIKTHFPLAKGGVAELKKRLRSLEVTTVVDSFVDYSSKFRQAFGIRSEKALDLFQQTVSMKSVGDLNTFVRQHMLQPADVKEKIDELKRNYENLDRAYRAVQQAKEQVVKLSEISRISDEVEIRIQTIQALSDCLTVLPVYIEDLKIKLFENEIKTCTKKAEEVSRNIRSIETDLTSQKDNLEIVRSDLDSSAEAKTLDQLDNEINELKQIRSKKQQKRQELDDLMSKIGLPKIMSDKDFYAALEHCGEISLSLEKERQELEGQKRELHKEEGDITKEINRTEAELLSLKSRKSQIPERNIVLRQLLCTGVGVNESDIPFIGELLRVKPAESAWEGAIERVLHNFGLSLLVDNAYYGKVSRFIDEHNLRGRIVYFRVQDKGDRIPLKFDPKELHGKVDIKAGSTFHTWLHNELCRGFGFVCCDTLDQFHKEVKAVTKSGQVKSSQSRHEKDDRTDISDRTRYILGWSNTEKVHALQMTLKNAMQIKASVDNKIEACRIREGVLMSSTLALHDILKFESFEDIDWRKQTVDIEVWEKYREELEKSSDKRIALLNEIKNIKDKIAQLEADLLQRNREKGAVDNQVEQFRQQLAEAMGISTMVKSEEKDCFYPKIDTLRDNREITLHNAARVRESINNEVMKLRKEEETRKEKSAAILMRNMTAYKHAFPADTLHVDASIESIPEFRLLLKKVQDEDLPRHEERFKNMLNEGVIKDMIMFKQTLDKEAEEIKDRVALINASLRTIAYNPATYIELGLTDAQHQDIRDFRSQLKESIEGTIGQDEMFTEEKFNRIKILLDRLNSGDPIDITWVSKVTDVRNWFEFFASEKYIEDGSEKEYYSDASGKSGGEKEKLAYTILASALAYQFGLGLNSTKSRSFRFVVIDEAFGRGSNESTRYALELFDKLNLQLLVITPLQKLHIIENYVKSVHYVFRGEGTNSVLRNLTIDQYREEKRASLAKREAIS